MLVLGFFFLLCLLSTFSKLLTRRFGAATDQPAAIDACGTKPGLAPSFEVPVPLLFQTTNRHGSARSDGCLRTKPGLAPSFEVPVPLLFAAGAIRNSFQDVKDQLSSSGFDFKNPGKPKAVEWASARSKQQPVQASVPFNQRR